MKRRDFLKSVTGVAAGAMVPAPAIWSAAKADARSETLLVVTESGPNNLDIHGVGTNRPGYEASWNCYDRLISHETKTLPDGTLSYDRDKFKPELAEDMKIGDMSVTFKLKKAKFHDGTPVTANDVKWSLDRSVSVGGFPTVQMKAGSLENKEQFVVVDDSTVRIDFAKKDRLTIPDLAVIVPGIYNSTLLKSKATDKDPWALDYTKSNTAGSGAYKVTSWKPGVETVYERHDDWVGGKLPQLRKVIWRTIPSQGNRRALMERGDADISFDLSSKDTSEMKKEGKLVIISNPIGNGMYSVELNVKNPPFNNEKVRQAVAYALPYQKIMDAAMFGLANPLFGGPSNNVTDIAWPAKSGYINDMAKAKALMAESGVSDIDTTVSFDLGAGDICEPIAVLVQESLGQIGIKTAINKVPGANWRSEMAKKSMPLMVNFFSGWLDYPEYFFFWCYSGQNAIFNTPSYVNPDMDTLIDAARGAAAVGDMEKYSKNVEGFISKAYNEVPRIPLFQPFLNVATQKNISGYVYWFHRQLDYRTIVKA
ncbi:peptide/nickel transport system substrate-binding protein [Bradyrhizobium lablabi]|uniref:Peptide/nickel transport system substrate-binding protein n=1 Tax=Bradyrhizobium lablabi TaxID=722472 RepID=A0A1M6WGS1_9BRAD|nr:ABC transporter substrate-binding protein [Bradyrhizobium lablabi]SHK92715.1 peptide/nickel transport system substrate-binding protein [Bradyrhizobium lablabi]